VYTVNTTLPFMTSLRGQLTTGMT